MISLNCECGKTLTVVDGHAGKRVRCKACGAEVRVPAAGMAPVAEPPGSVERALLRTLLYLVMVYSGLVVVAGMSAGRENDRPPAREAALCFAVAAAGLAASSRGGR